MAIVQELKKDPRRDKKNNVESIEKLSSQEKMLRGKQQAQQRLDLVNQLTAYVSTYSNAVLAYIKIFQEVAILLEAVMMLMMHVMMIIMLMVLMMMMMVLLLVIMMIMVV